MGENAPSRASSTLRCLHTQALTFDVFEHLNVVCTAAGRHLARRTENEVEAFDDQTLTYLSTPIPSFPLKLFFKNTFRVLMPSGTCCILMVAVVTAAVKLGSYVVCTLSKSTTNSASHEPVELVSFGPGFAGYTLGSSAICSVRSCS